ncbi:phenylalanine--tRNA ligase subunit beta [Streptomyces sp. 7N604]|uniref:phenylalanine--tRNA ligase subunit beta n=1 Tax=Streptomyces sp. 7N604 TaxID=3457415 RepID=UPI003FD624DF
MKISLNWLSDYVDLGGLTPEAVADRLTLATAEVEGFDVVTNRADSAVVARITAVEQIAPATDGSPGLRAVTVDTGTGTGPHTTVTSAVDVAEGMLAAYAPVGAELPAGRLEAARVGGRTSEGMLCSPSDIGLGTASDTVLRCPPGSEPGTPLSKWIPLRDVLVEIDNKSLTHRPDLWGHYGFARELAAILHQPLRRLDVTDLAAYDALPEFPVTNEGGEDCPVVTALAVDVADNAASPLEIQARLHVLGQRTFNVLVDLTNYVMLELGQPTHAYDRDRVGSLRVAPAHGAATFRTLDDQERSLVADDLLIWGDAGPVGLAGIMGGLDSGVSPGTRRVLLESANFRAARVRRTSMRLGLRTDAGQRFEKNQPPSVTRLATGRIVRLLDEAGARPEATSRFTVRGDLRDRVRTVEMDAGHVQRCAGADISDAQVDAILTALDFTTSRKDGRLVVGVPAFRGEQDIAIPADVVEEVLRVYGYGEIEPRLPEARLEPVDPNPAIRREHKARRILAGAHGFAEMQTYLWTDDDWLSRIGFDPGEVLRLRNPIAPEKARLRTTLLPNLFKVAQDNLGNSDEYAVFEIGRVILVGDGRHEEVSRLAGVSVRPSRGVALEDHYREVKGALEAVVRTIGRGTLRAEPDKVGEGEAPWRVPDLTAVLSDDSGPVGTAGVLYGPILDTVTPQRQAVWFELDIDRLTGPLYATEQYRPFSVYPDSRQDFSVLWPVAGTYAGLERTLDEFGHPLVQRREFLLSYKGKGLEPGIGSYTFRYWLAHPERTLSGEDLEEFRAGFLRFLDSRELSLR